MSAEIEGIVVRPINEPGVRAFLSWRYEPPYDFYNVKSLDPDQEIRYLLDPETHCHGMYGQAGDLLAICTFGADARVTGGNYRAPALDLGLGVRPDLTGRGLGHTFVAAVLAFARGEFSPQAYRVTIAAFNGRAIRVWTRAGFRHTQDFETPLGVAYRIFLRQPLPGKS